MRNLKAREVAQALGLDQAMVSRFERGERLPNENQVNALARLLEIDQHGLLTAWLKERILQEVGTSPYAREALMMACEALPPQYTSRKTEITTEIQHLLNQIDAFKSQLNALRAKDNQRIAEALQLEYIYESNRIEGNTLTLSETHLVVHEGLTISGKSMREHLEAINHHDAIGFIVELSAKNHALNRRDLLQIHQLVVRGIHPRDAGRYRSVPVMISGSIHTPPQPWQVEPEMEQYFAWYNNNRKSLHPVVLAAEMHERLVTIHPFIDGNGRTSRLIMNFILLQHGYVIANIRGDGATRAAYYAALEASRTDVGKNAFIKLIAEAELTAMQRYIQVLG